MYEKGADSYKSGMPGIGAGWMISLYLATHLAFLSIRSNQITSDYILCPLRFGQSKINLYPNIRSTDFFDTLNPTNLIYHFRSVFIFYFNLVRRWIYSILKIRYPIFISI